MMYCLCCGEIVEPATIHVRSLEYDQYLTVCPRCGAGENRLVDTWRCDVCGEMKIHGYLIKKDKSFICSDCAEEVGE